jgi:F0F1-type ATP synthase delta subunit
MTAQFIQKEQLSEVKFTQASDLNPKEKSELMTKLKKSEMLGNGFKNKCKIYFSALGGLKVVETTIWIVSNEYINLKGGQTIPVNSILDIEF